MTEPFDDGTEDRLRAILRSEADSVTPSPDALERIRARTDQRPFASWFGLTWLRPVVAVAAAVGIVGSVLLGSPQVREQILPDSINSADSSNVPAVDPTHKDDPDQAGTAPDGGAPGAAEDDDPTLRPTSPPAGGTAAPGPESGITMACTPPPTPQPPQARSNADQQAYEDCQDKADPEDPGTTPGGETPTEPPPSTPEPEPEPSDAPDPMVAPE